jgi:hypothetical protein
VQELFDEAFQERLRQPGVCAEEDHDLTQSAPTTKISAPGHRAFAVEGPDAGETLGHGERAVARTGVDNYHLLRLPRLTP